MNLGIKLGVDNDKLRLFPNPHGKAVTKAQIVGLIQEVVSAYYPRMSHECLTAVLFYWLKHLSRVLGLDLSHLKTYALKRSIQEIDDPQKLRPRIQVAQSCDEDQQTSEAVVAEATGYILNVMSSKVHTQKNTGDQHTYNWITCCGWRWAGKRHVNLSEFLPIMETPT